MYYKHKDTRQPIIDDYVYCIRTVQSCDRSKIVWLRVISEKLSRDQL